MQENWLQGNKQGKRIDLNAHGTGIDLAACIVSFNAARKYEI